MAHTHRAGCMATGLVVLTWTALSAGAELKAQSSTTNPYRATFGWERLPEGRVMGTVSGVFPDPDGRHPRDPAP